MEENEKRVEAGSQAEGYSHVSHDQSENLSVYDEIGLEDSFQKKKREFRKKVFVFFAFGFLIGIALKAEALRRVSIGFNDYQMQIQRQDYDLNWMQAEFLKRFQEESAPPEGMVETGEDDSASFESGEIEE